MNRKEFEPELQSQSSCNPVVVSRWIQFADECIDIGQYIDLVLEVRRTGAHSWLCGIFASLYFARIKLGYRPIKETFRLTECIHCLYSREIMGAIGNIMSDGDVSDLLEKLLGGALDYDGSLPTANVVERDLMRNRNTKSKER